MGALGTRPLCRGAFLINKRNPEIRHLLKRLQQKLCLEAPRRGNDVRLRACTQVSRLSLRSKQQAAIKLLRYAFGRLSLSLRRPLMAY